MRVSGEIYNLLQPEESVVVVVVFPLVSRMNQEVVRLQDELRVLSNGSVVVTSTQSSYL